MLGLAGPGAWRLVRTYRHRAKRWLANLDNQIRGSTCFAGLTRYTHTSDQPSWGDRLWRQWPSLPIAMDLAPTGFPARTHIVASPRAPVQPLGLARHTTWRQQEHRRRLARQRPPILSDKAHDLLERAAWAGQVRGVATPHRRVSAGADADHDHLPSVPGVRAVDDDCVCRGPVRASTATTPKESCGSICQSALGTLPMASAAT